jgi:hypothetical protein
MGGHHSICWVDTLILKWMHVVVSKVSTTIFTLFLHLVEWVRVIATSRRAMMDHVQRAWS